MSFLEIFQPGLRHLREERDRQKLTVARPPAAGGPPLGIDLEAGTARIPGPPVAEETEPEAIEPGPTEPEQSRPEATGPGHA